MILALAVLAVAATVPLAGGNLGRIAALRLRRLPVLAAALALQVVIISVLPGDLPARLANNLHLASYALAAYWVLANLHIPGLWALAIGGGCNIAALTVNGGVMPALPSALRAAGRAGPADGFTNSAAVQGARLQWLGDVFAIPHGWPLANVFSIGDVLLVVGAALLLHRACGSRLRPARI